MAAMILAIVPCAILLLVIYKKDTVEKEPPGLLFRLFLYGCLTTVAASILEIIGTGILMATEMSSYSLLYQILDNFVVVACAEEGVKRFALRKGSWKNPNFNYLFDGVVYAVFVGIGFAAVENVLYVASAYFHYGINIAPVRAVTAIPLHCIAAVFMGHYYGLAKYCEVRGDRAGRKHNMRLSFWIPVLLHGFYDFCATNDAWNLSGVFLVFVVVLDILAIRKVNKYSASDAPFQSGAAVFRKEDPRYAGYDYDMRDHSQRPDNALWEDSGYRYNHAARENTQRTYDNAREYLQSEFSLHGEDDSTDTQ